MSTIFQSFSASPRDRAALLSWTYNSGFDVSGTNGIKYLCVNYSDTNINNLDVQIASQEIIPVIDAQGNIVTSYTLGGLINGKEYILSLEATTKNDTVENSSSQKITTAAAPSKPNFSLAQTSSGTFSIKLLDNLENTPTPVSDFDSYSRLTIAYVTYNNGSVIKTESFLNDPSNTLYTRALEISGLPLGLYEINVKTANSQGMSVLSNRKSVSILSLPDAPLNLTATPTMLIDPSFTFANVSVSLAWNPPVFLGDPSLNQYKLYRNNNLIATLVRDQSGNLPTKYVDNEGVVAGRLYTYKVESINANVDTNNPARFITQSVTALDKPSIISVTRTSQDESFVLDISYNPNGFASNEITFDLSGNNLVAAANLTSDSHTVSGLTNGTTYSYQVRVKGTRSVNSVPKTYASNYTQVGTSMPYAPLETVSTLAALETDGSGNPATPLDGKINLSWVEPSNASYRPSDYTITLYKKLDGAPDASYVLLADIAKGTQKYTVENLINGTSYRFKAVKSQLLVETGQIIQSAKSEVERRPFALPSAIRDLSFNNTTMSVAFRTNVTGGLSLSDYSIKLYNLSNGGESLVATINQNIQDQSGIVVFDLSSAILNTTPFTPGKKYRLDVTPRVTSYSVVYSGPTVSKTAFTRPDALNAPIVANVDDASSNPLDGKLWVKWSLPADYDASNVSYDLYVAGSPAPIVGASNLSRPCFLHSGLTNGALYQYEVVVKIGGIASPRSPASVAKSPFKFPGVISELTATVNSSTTATLSWQAPDLLSTGVDPSELRYKVTDLSDNVIGQNISATSQSLTGLSAGVAKVFNVIVGVAKNSTVYYRSDSVNTDVATYGTVTGPFGVQVFPSDRTVLVDLSDASVVAGLDFSKYRYNYKLSNSQSWGSNNDQTQSLFYINNLTNNVSYDVKVALIYTTRNLVPREVSSVDVSLSAIPQLAPPQPTGLEAKVGFKEIELSWNYDNTNATGFYSIFLNNELAVAHLPANQNNISTVNGKWSRTFTNLVAGRSYTIDIVAEKLVSGTVYVSSQTASITAMPYDVPTQVRSLSYIPGDKTLNLSWSAPSSSSGAGLSGNSSLKYRVELVNPANNGQYSKVFDNIMTTSYVIGSTPMVDSSGITFSLQNGQAYTVKVRAFFDIANTDGQAVSDPVDLVVKPNRLPVRPVLTASALDTSADGQLVELKLALDVSCTSQNTKIKFTREIRNSTGTLLSTKTNSTELSSLTIDGSGVVTYRDSPSSSPTQLDNDTNFLNGNVMTYTCEVKSESWTNNYDNVQTTLPVSVTPSGKALIESISIDGSGNVLMTLNKNGSSFNSLNIIGIDAITQKVQVQTVSSSNVNFSNNQSSGLAKNQQAQLTIQRSDWVSKVTKVLAIFSTTNSTATKDSPNGSFAA